MFILTVWLKTYMCVCVCVCVCVCFGGERKWETNYIFLENEGNFSETLGINTETRTFQINRHFGLCFTISTALIFQYLEGPSTW